MRRWLDDYEAVAERLACGPRFVETFRKFVTSLREKLLRPWDRALSGKHFFFFRRRAVRLSLNRGERSAIRNAELRAVLEELSAAVDQAGLARGQRVADFEGALARWRCWLAGRSWLDALGRLEAAALRQRHDLQASDERWDRSWSGAVERLRDWLREVDALLEQYGALLSARDAAEEVSVRLTRAQREALDPGGAEEAVAWLEGSWPAPSETVEAVFALWELGMEAARPEVPLTLGGSGLS
jgi:hypothetical protein